MDWYYRDGDTRIGPVTDDHMRELALDGTITPKTLVWNELSAKWQPYNEIAGTVGLPPSSVQSEPVRAAANETNEDAPWDPYASDADVGRQADSSKTPEALTERFEAYCSQCFNKFPAEAVIRYGDANICAACKPLFFQKLKEGAETNGTLRYGGFWVRFVAKSIDGIIMGMIGMLIAAIAGFSILGHDKTFAMTPFRLGAYMMINILQIALGVAYATFFVGKYGATPGKMALSLKVINPDGSKVSYMKAFGRHFAEFISGIIFLIGYIMAAFDDEKRALHDRICSTRVIRKAA
jgi:uncharacterized RDD family membrane protein YckC